MYWRSGESIDGTLAGADAKALSWKADLFAEPLQVHLSSLLRVEMPPPPPRVSVAAPLESFSILLKSGDHLYADIQSITPEGLVLTSQRHSTVKVPLSAVQTIDRLRGDGLVYSGPQGVAGWKSVAVPQQQQQGSPWMAGERGGLLSRTWNRTVKMDLPLPDKVLFEIVISSPLRPQFALGFSPEADSAPTIETWQDELVVADQGLFAPLRTLTEGDHSVALRIFWDRPGKVMKIHDWTGGLIAEFHPGHNDPSNMGIVLRNKGAELTLERLNVRLWDGTPCPKYDPALGWLRQLGGSTLEGTITASIEGLTITPVNGSPQTVPLAQIAAMNLGAEAAKMEAKKVPLPEMLTEMPPPESLPTRLRFADGTLMTGTLLQIENNTALMRLTGLAEPVSANLKDMTRLALNEPAPLSTPPEKPLARMDVLHVGNSYLHGTFEGSGDATLRWRAVGGLSPTAINTDRKDLEIRRQVSSGVTQQPALLFLNDDNVLAAELRGINAEGVQLSSPIAEVKALKNESLHAIHFNAPKSTATGFSEPGWQTVKGTEKEVRVKDGTLVLNNGGAFGHPSIMFGDEISFTLTMPGAWGALAVELFTGDLESRSRSTRLHLIYSGADFWAVMEDTENNSRSSEQLRNLSRKDVNLRLVFDESSVLLFANDMMVMSAPLSQEKREGTGIVFSPSNMWGSPGRDVQVSNFSVKARPDFLQVPAISAEARHQALLVPRFRRENPPTHALLAPNGDLLRGRIEEATGKTIRFMSGAEDVEIPTDRVAAAVWLTKPVEPPPTTQATPQSVSGTASKGMVAETSPSAPNPSFAPTHWMVLQDGSRLALKVDRFERDAIVATSPLLGACRIPSSNLAQLRLSAMPATMAMTSYRNWQLEYAPEPVLPETGGESSPLLNKPAPGFALPLLGGEQFSLDSEKGHIVVLDFWATWCGPCVASMPENLKAMSQFDTNRVKFVGVNQGEPEPQVAKFLQTRGWQMIVAMDAQQSVGRLYGVDSIPHQVIVGPTGKVEWVNSGFSPGASEKMVAVIKRLLAPAATVQ